MRSPRCGLRILPLAVFLGACALPQRDNIHDPAKAPVAILQIRVLVAGTALVSNQGTRNTIFVLDASASVDPFHDSQLSFDWDLDGDGTFETPRNTTEPCPGTGVLACKLTSFAIEASQLPPSGVGSVPRTVAVNVSTPAGYHAKAAASLAVSNAAPIVDAGDELTAVVARRPIVTLDVCGGLPLDCPSYDPDGDSPTYTWTQIRGETVPIVVSGSGRASIPAPASAQLLSFRVTADDGLAKTTSVVHVRVGQPTWLSAMNPSRLFRVFPEFTSRPVDGGILGTPAGGETQIVTSIAADPGTGEIFLATERIDGLLQNLERRVLRLSDDLRVLGSVNVGPVGTIEDLVARGTWACVLLDEVTSVTVGRVNIVGGGVYQPIGSPDATFVRRVIADPANGTDCLVVTDLGAYRIGSSAGTFQPIAQAFNLPAPIAAPLPDVPPLAWTASPDGAMWVTNGATLVRFLGGIRFEIALAPAISDVRGIVPRLGGGLWALAGDSSRLHRIDETGTTTQQTGVGPFGPFALQFPYVGPRHVASDPIDGSVWIANNVLARLERLVEKDGELTLAGSIRPEENPAGLAQIWDDLTVDVRGGRAVVVSGLNSTTFSQDSVVAIPLHMRRTADVALGGGVTSTDQSRGAAWNSYDKDVYRVTSDGRILARIAVTNTVLGIAGVDADLEGGAWIGDGDLIHVDGSGTELQRISMPCSPTTLDGGTSPELCVGCQRPGLAGFSRMFRVVPSTGAVTELSAPGNLYNMSNATRTEDGACWFLDTFFQIPQSDLIRVGPGASVGVNYTGFRGTGLTPDPRDTSTVWMLNTFSVGDVRFQRISSGGALLTNLPAPVPAFGLHTRCLDVGNPQCVEFWHGSGGTGSQFFRADSVTGGIIESFDLPAGTPALFEIP